MVVVNFNGDHTAVVTLGVFGVIPRGHNIVSRQLKCRT